jgi:hypothetical protein
MSGKCKYGEKCKFSHDATICDTWKSSNPSVTLREVLEEEGVDADMNPVAPPELAGIDGADEMTCEEEGAEDNVPQMYPEPEPATARPIREGLSATNRKMRPEQAALQVNTTKLQLPPLTGPLKRGHHQEFSAKLSGLDITIGVTADSGAQVPAISLRCASEAWRGQEAKVKQLENLKAARAFTGCERMITPQKFFGFKGPAGGATEVDVVGALRIRLAGVHADTEVPMVVEVEIPQVRVCPDQEDDFLAANPVLLDWGWEPGRDAIVFHNLGKLKVKVDQQVLPWSDGGVTFKIVEPPVPRVEGDGFCSLKRTKVTFESDVNEGPKLPTSSAPTPTGIRLLAEEQWTLDAFEERLVRCRRVRPQGAQDELPDETWWVKGNPNLAEGPVKTNQEEVYLKVCSD